VFQAVKNLGRLEKITSVFIKYGFGYFVERLGLRDYLSLKIRHEGAEERRFTRGES